MEDFYMTPQMAKRMDNLNRQMEETNARLESFLRECERPTQRFHRSKNTGHHRQSDKQSSSLTCSQKESRTVSSVSHSRKASRGKMGKIAAKVERGIIAKEKYTKSKEKVERDEAKERRTGLEELRTMLLPQPRWRGRSRIVRRCRNSKSKSSLQSPLALSYSQTVSKVEDHRSKSPVSSMSDLLTLQVYQLAKDFPQSIKKTVMEPTEAVIKKMPEEEKEQYTVIGTEVGTVAGLLRCSQVSSISEAIKFVDSRKGLQGTSSLIKNTELKLATSSDMELDTSYGIMQTMRYPQEDPEGMENIDSYSNSSPKDVVDKTKRHH